MELLPQGLGQSEEQRILRMARHPKEQRQLLRTGQAPRRSELQHHRCFRMATLQGDLWQPVLQEPTGWQTETQPQKYRPPGLQEQGMRLLRTVWHQTERQRQPRQGLQPEERTDQRQHRETMALPKLLWMERAG